MNLKLFSKARRNYVTCHFQGQLCNQMFQAATTLAYAWEHDLRPVFTRKQITYVTSPRAAGRNRVTREFAGLPTVLRSPPERKVLVNREPASGCYKKIRFVPGYNMIIQGWRQSELYFRDYRARLLEAFAFSHADTRYLQGKYGHQLAANSVSLHVRRTDYVGNGAYANLYAEGYYDLALDFLRRHLKIPIDQLFIFSDDIAWCKKNLQFNLPTTFVVEERDILDLALMSMCRYNIIANSTFSWWGAWLNDRPGKIVIAPSGWYSSSMQAAGKSHRDLVCEDWIRI